MAFTPTRAFYRLLQRIQHIGNRLWRPLTMGVRAIVLDEQDRVFLVRHSYAPGWHLPGGGVEPGETVVTSLERELVEEGNIEVTGAPQLLGLYFNGVGSDRDHVAVFVVRSFRQTAPRKPDWEIVECDFFPVEALPVGVTRATRDRLVELRHGIAPSPRW
jgi:ADP-ribose pyrophosphatase YjhB (NUDIX family)